MKSSHSSLRPLNRAQAKNWEKIPHNGPSILKFNEFKAEAERLSELRKKHDEWVLWTKEPEKDFDDT